MSGDSNKLGLTRNATILVVVSLIVLGIVSRLLPHPPNFAPITALALFGGAMLPKNYGLWLPLGAIILSDLIIGLHDTLIFTWGSFAVIALVAQRKLSGKVSVGSVGFAAIGSSVFFYLVTNFGVWIQGTIYPLTAEGLVSSYIQGIPFFRNTLLGDVFYSGVFFGAYYFAVKTVVKYKPQLAKV